VTEGSNVVVKAGSIAMNTIVIRSKTTASLSSAEIGVSGGDGNLFVI
jgi:hypothetical protein